MNRAIKLTGLLAAALLIGACEHKTDDVGDYNPALDGPTLPPSPVISSALLEGKAGGGEIKQPPKPPTTPAEQPATATAPSDTATTAPTDSPVTAGDPDAAKSEIETRLDQVKKLFADANYEEYEKAGCTPAELKAKTDADAQAIQKKADEDKADPAKEQKQFDSLFAAVKATKPTLSTDGTLATYKFGDGAPLPAFAFKKVDGVWYPSETETAKLLGIPAPTPAPAPAPGN